MARRGRFGRNRGGSQNLTALIAALMREQRQAEDRAIFDAYRNGGLFQGKPVDDKRLLGYIQSRRDGFTRDDPLWDEWNNRLIQQKFAIGESEIGLKFKQGKVGAGAVAAFYRSQLKSIPRNSAFYREVAGRAAEWAKAAAASARAGGRRRAEAALTARLQKIMDKIDTFRALDAFLTQEAKRQGIIAGNQTLTDADATALAGMFERGINYQGAQVTLETWRAAAAQNYQNWNDIVRVSKQGGRAYKDLANARNAYLNQYLVRLNAVDDRVKYELAREQYHEAIEDAQGDPEAELRAAQDYVKALQGIRATAAGPTGDTANDPEFLGGIQNEINAITTGKVTGPTVTDLQSNTGEGVVTNDADDLAQSAGIINQANQLLASGAAYFGQTEPGGRFAVIPFPPTAASDATGRKGLDPSVQPAVVTIGGRARVVYLQGQAIQAAALIDTATGQPIDPASVDPQQIGVKIRDGEWQQTTTGVVGYTYTIPAIGGQPPTQKWGIVNPDGSITFTSENPFLSGIVSPDGTVLTAGEVTLNDRGEAVVRPNFGAAVRPLTNAEDLLVDSTVSLVDLARTLRAGQVVGLDEERAAAILQDATNTLARQQQVRERTALAREGVVGSPSLVDRVAAAAGVSPLQNAVTGVLDIVRDTLRPLTTPGIAPPPSVRDVNTPGVPTTPGSVIDPRFSDTHAVTNRELFAPHGTPGGLGPQAPKATDPGAKAIGSVAGSAYQKWLDSLDTTDDEIDDSFKQTKQTGSGFGHL